ncbi:IQ calmodulin-binding motif domain-containing protein [Toxoplasma gondii ARI]|uniref:IQ calmodulin-binding motif domain-containing protein n=1 Tax=Toxoplasma gondii ARI TaxID=1074872 RepID=A0A139XPE7_TOXGO|nr:IQ calmodulin-binding motif domain-containing protein [Toxoplasma gondii ARI]
MQAYASGQSPPCFSPDQRRGSGEAGEKEIGDCREQFRVIVDTGGLGSILCEQVPAEAVGHMKELLRSHIRSWLHFPLFRHVVSVNSARPFAHSFCGSAPSNLSSAGLQTAERRPPVPRPTSDGRAPGVEPRREAREQRSASGNFSSLALASVAASCRDGEASLASADPTQLTRSDVSAWGLSLTSKSCQQSERTPEQAAGGLPSRGDVESWRDRATTPALSGGGLLKSPQSLEENSGSLALYGRRCSQDSEAGEGSQATLTSAGLLKNGRESGGPGSTCLGSLSPHRSRCSSLSPLSSSDSSSVMLSPSLKPHAPHPHAASPSCGWSHPRRARSPLAAQGASRRGPEGGSALLPRAEDPEQRDLREEVFQENETKRFHRSMSGISGRGYDAGARAYQTHLFAPAVFSSLSGGHTWCCRAALVSCVEGTGGALNGFLSPPPTKLQVLRCMLADTAAVTIQRVFRGHLGRLCAERRKVEKREFLRLSAAATKIQAGWRRVKAQETFLVLHVCETLASERNAAAVKIQAFWKMRIQRDKYRTMHLTECLAALRRLAAVELQRVWRGSVTRKVLDDEWQKWIIKWPWDKPGTIVEVVGDFSNPPWTKRYLMTYCYVRRCFILPLPRRPGRYEVKFIVDGRYVCDGSQTVVADGNGHFNNLIRVRAETKSPFREVRERLHQLQEQNQMLIYRSASSPLFAPTRPSVGSHSLEDMVVTQGARLPRQSPVHAEALQNCGWSSGEDLEGQAEETEPRDDENTRHADRFERSGSGGRTETRTVESSHSSLEHQRTEHLHGVAGEWLHAVKSLSEFTDADRERKGGVDWKGDLQTTQATYSCGSCWHTREADAQVAPTTDDMPVLGIEGVQNAAWFQKLSGRRSDAVQSGSSSEAPISPREVPASDPLAEPDTQQLRERQEAPGDQGAACAPRATKAFDLEVAGKKGDSGDRDSTEEAAAEADIMRDTNSIGSFASTRASFVDRSALPSVEMSDPATSQLEAAASLQDTGCAREVSISVTGPGSSGVRGEAKARDCETSVSTDAQGQSAGESWTDVVENAVVQERKAANNTKGNEHGSRRRRRNRPSSVRGGAEGRDAVVAGDAGVTACKLAVGSQAAVRENASQVTHKREEGDCAQTAGSTSHVVKTPEVKMAAGEEPKGESRGQRGGRADKKRWHHRGRGGASGGRR